VARLKPCPSYEEFFRSLLEAKIKIHKRVRSVIADGVLRLNADVFYRVRKAGFQLP